ncbi:MAG: hypothetical protein V1664_01300 [Candidatus Uhrbacteria bacterium]
MLLLLRIFPFLLVLTLIGSWAALFWLAAPPLLVILITCLVSLFLLAGLAGWSFKKSDFWFLLGIPYFLILSFFSFLIFLEAGIIKSVAAILVLLLVWLFAENLFNFVHRRGAYQVNALEYLTLVINITSVYFITASLLASKLFLGLPLWFLTGVFSLIIFGLVASTFWVCKIEKKKILLLALSGGVLAGEIFLSLAFLPVSFLVNAAFITIFFYLFFGLLRAGLFGKLSAVVWQRYLLAAVIFFVLVASTARWT